MISGALARMNKPQRLIASTSMSQVHPVTCDTYWELSNREIGPGLFGQAASPKDRDRTHI